MKNLKDMGIKELKLFFEEAGEKKFRAEQVFSWIYRGVTDFDEMNNIPKSLREKLKKISYISSLEVIVVQKSKSDGTRKYLFGLEDGNRIESVFMKYKYGNTLCVSSQAGCRMGCRFCASTLDGLRRNLTAGEIADQIISVQRDTGEKINHVVIMGTGEPFDNYENISEFIRNINEKSGLNIGMRNITVSTCGLVPKILKFANDFPQVNLAVSLHAADSNVRSEMMPINKKYNVDVLIDTCRKYTEITHRRITFEYALVFGKNDSDTDIALLIEKIRGMLCHVNLIPLNKVEESGLEGSSRKRGEKIAAMLEKNGIPATVRRELGADIDGACGQLRLSESVESNRKITLK